MKVRFLLIGVVVLFVVGILTTSGYASIDSKTIAGMWLFDEGSGKIAKDSSGNKNDGTLTGGPVWVAGKFGQALSFDGKAAYVSIPNSTSLNPTTAITMAAWIQPKDITTATYIEIMRQESGNTRKLFSFQLNGTQLTLGIETAGAYWETDFPITAKNFTDGKWHHVAYTYDGAKAILYVDGSLNNSQAHTGKIGVTAGKEPLMIGCSAGSGEWFTGLIDEAAMFSVALSLADIQALMNQGLTVTAVDLSGKLSTTWSAIKAQ